MRAATPDEQADRERDYRKHEWRPGDRLPLNQQLALAKLIGYAEAISTAGLLGEPTELRLREIVAEALAAFNLPSKVDRETADA